MRIISVFTFSAALANYIHLPKGISENLSPNELQKLGFKQYYNKTFAEYGVIKYLKPPTSAKEIFMGCRGINKTDVQIGIFGQADFIFTQRLEIYVKKIYRKVYRY